MSQKLSYYEILGVKRESTNEEIRSAFKKLVLHKHPDRGGDESEFIAVQSAFEVLNDLRKRRIYDRFGEEGLKTDAESLLAREFRAGSFAGGSESGSRDWQSEMDRLRRENESLQRQLMIIKPETGSQYANSFEAWLRNRNPGDLQVVTSETIARQYGVVEGSYDTVKLPALKSTVAEFTDMGDLADVVQSKEYSLPTELRWGEVLVHMLAAPVTATDRHLGRWYVIPGVELPAHPTPAGSEGIGMVLRVGPGVKSLKERDLVMPNEPLVGTWRKLAVLDSNKLFAFPPTTQGAEVIANFYAYLTAYRLLEDYGAIKPGDTIIQSQADTAVGQAVIQLAKMLHIKTINLVDDRDDFDEVVDHLNAQGATHVWKNTGSILSRIKKTRTSLPRLAIDAQGGATVQRLIECLRPDATLVTYGATSGTKTSLPYSALLYNNIECRGFWPYKWLKDHAEGFQKMAALLLPLLEESKLSIELTRYSAFDAKSLNKAFREKQHNMILHFATIEEAAAFLPAD